MEAGTPSPGKGFGRTDYGFERTPLEEHSWAVGELVAVPTAETSNRQRRMYDEAAATALQAAEVKIKLLVSNNSSIENNKKGKV